MKKLLTSIMILTLTVLISGGIVVATNNTHSETATQSNVLLATAENSFNNQGTLKQFISKDETVYLTTNHTGTVNKIFIGNTIATDNKPLPISMEVAYYLDGNEISADELAGKSGHVIIEYSFTSLESRQDKLVPFLTVTGLELDNSKFKNLKFSNAKILKETADQTIIAGYALVGLDEDLGTDFFANGFSVEADVSDFRLSTAYTLATNELFADIDTSKLNSIDEIITQINQLSSALDQIISGSSSLAEGLDTALAGAQKLQAGTNELAAGANKLAAGASTIDTSMHDLATGAKQLSDGLNSVVSINSQIMSKVNTVTKEIQAKAVELNNVIAEIAETDPKLANQIANGIAELSGYYNHAYTAVNEYVDGIEKLANGASALKDGANALADGTTELKNGAVTLANGSSELSNGVASLSDGLNQLAVGGNSLKTGLNAFKTQGIDKLVNFANHDLEAFSYNLRQTINAARNYHYYSNSNAQSVKFIFKTPAV